MRRELESIHENLRESSRGWAAWRIEGTLREFRSFKPKNLWFEYPVHLPDETGALADLKCEGEYDPRAKWTKGQEAAKKACKSVQQQKIDLIREAMEQCVEDGVKPTRVNVLERIGDVKINGKPFNEGALKYATGEKAKWSPFRVKEDTDILYDKNNQALDFDGEIDLSE